MFGADFGAAGTQFGVGTAEDVENLNKALTTGDNNIPPSGGYALSGQGGQGSALRVESLESTLKVTTFSERHIIFWKDIPKLPAFNTVEEFNQLNEYGNQGGMFLPEGVAPESSDSQYTRKTVQIKYLGTLRQVTHVMTLVRPAHGDVIALETLNGTRELLRTLEEKLFTGDSACNAFEWDGVHKQITDGWGTETAIENAIDMRGQPLDEKTMGDAARIIIDNYGFPTSMYLGFGPMQDINQLMFERQRAILPQNISQAGFAMTGFQTVGGQYDFKPSVFLKPGRVLPTAARGNSSNVPSMATVTVTPATAAADALSKQSGSATYTYAVTVENRYGESAGSAQLASVSLTAGQSSVLTIAGIPNTGASAATAVNLFRRTGTSGDFKFVKRLPTAGAASITFTERDLFQPGTSTVYLLQVDLDVMSFKQLAPFTKIALATIDPSIRWMQLLYGSPAVYQPKKCVIIRNVGQA